MSTKNKEILPIPLLPDHMKETDDSEEAVPDEWLEGEEGIAQLERLFGIGKPAQVIEGVWLGAMQDAEDAAFIKKNIDSIINVSESLYDTVISGRRYIHYPLRCFEFHRDATEWKMAHAAVRGLHEEHKAGRRILIHCWAGIDRSPTILTRFLAQKYHISDYLAAQMIKKARPVAQPHLDWWIKPKGVVLK